MSTSTMALLTTTPTSITRPITLWMLRLVPVSSSAGTTPISATGTDSMTISGSMQPLELPGHQHVDQHHRHQDGDDEVAAGLLLLLVLAAEDDGVALGQGQPGERARGSPRWRRPGPRPPRGRR